MVYFITGGSRGIGRGLVLAAARAGHDVAFTYRSNREAADAVVEEARALGAARVGAWALDVCDPAAVETVCDEIVDEFDTVHVVINNAGISRDGLIFTMEDEDWDAVIRTNLYGPFYVSRQLLPVLIANKWGRIINISSVVAGGSAGQGNYAASKAGLHGLTQTLAKEYGRRGITANAVVPGFVETDMTLEHLSDVLRDFWANYAPVPRGRVGTIEELAATVMFLASEPAGFINGQIIHVTGGLDWGP